MGGSGPPTEEPSRLDEMRFEKVEPVRPDWQMHLFAWAMYFLLPRRYLYWSRWPSRLHGARLALYLAFKVGQGMAIRYWVVPGIRRIAREHERGRGELRESSVTGPPRKGCPTTRQRPSTSS